MAKIANSGGKVPEKFDLKDVEMKDVFIKLSKASPQSSPPWNYFGFLHFYKPSVRVVEIVSTRVFFTACFEKSAVLETNLFKVDNVKNYSYKTSTSNLFLHLETEHKISIASKSIVAAVNSVRKYFSTERKDRPDTTAEKKFVLIRDLALLCSRDLLPFNIVDGAGMRDFFEKYKISSVEEIPNRTSISRALTTVYDDCKAWLVNFFRDNCPDTIACTFDLWSCRYRRRTYITLTTHVVTKEFELVNATLSTSYFADRHTGINILPRIESILDSFGLSDKDTKMITDGAANMGTTCAKGTYLRFKCIGHGLHNLVVKDGFKKTKSIHELLKKVRQIVKQLRYRSDQFERLSKDEEFFLGEMIQLSEQFLLSDDEDDDYEELDTENDENFPKTYKTLKIDVATRWHSAVPMIQCLLDNNRSVVKFLLLKVEAPELILINAEYNLLKELLDFLKQFQVITAILSGDKYATMNYYVVFRQEVSSLLESEPKDSIEIKEMKANMLKNIEHRFPMTDETVIASLLDPRFQNLFDVGNYLRDRSISAIEFIESFASTIVDTNRQIVTESLEENAPERGPKKSYIAEMIEKHSTLASIARSTATKGQGDLKRECFLLLSMGGVVEVSNILAFYKTNSKTFPLLSQVSRRIYCMPATSPPSERNFSTSGYVSNSKRSEIIPENLDKVTFVHNNYDLIKKHTCIIPNDF